MPGSRVIQHLCAIALLCALFESPLFSAELKQRPQPTQDSRESNQGLPQVQRLSPPLLAKAFLRFSPNGRFLLLQDAAGLFVISRQPLQLMFYVDAPGAYPAEFSADSRTISLLGRDLSFGTWLLADTKLIDKRELVLPAGCLDARLVAGAQWFACLSPQLAFQLYQSSDLKRVYAQRADLEPSGFARFPVPLHFDSPFAGPFGYVSASDFSLFANRGIIHLPALISPDAQFLLINHEHNSFRLDLPSLTKSNLPAPVRKRSEGLQAIQPENRVLVLDRKKEALPSILSLATGEVVASPSFSADGASLASNSRYALLHRFATATTSIFDLQLNEAIDAPENLAADVYGDTLALYRPDGELQFFRLRQEQPFDGGRLPLGGLPAPDAALVDPSLSTLAIAANGVGAVYDLATGRRLADIGAFRGLYFASRQEAFWLQPALPDSPATVSHWTSAPAASAGAAWKAGKFAELVPGAAAFIEYSFYSQHGSEHPSLNLSGEIPFQLRGLDPATGRELWKHVYVSDPPVPFNDPQGDRLVLGWKAKSPGAWESAKHSPAARELLKRQKLQDLDAFFEVLDSRTGNSLGGVLVQFGSGASSFDSAFSCGDALLLVKDRYRVTLFDLRTGTQLARLRGQHPAASAATKILALDEGGKLVFYDLASGARLGQRRFSDGIAYFRFAEKGDRFFVLTNHQQFFLLDVKKLLDASAKSPSEDH